MEVDQGCDLAVRLYAAAAQIYAMYLQADWVARQAFPQTAEGDYLDLHAQLRGLERKQASHAAGTLRFFADQAAETPREIPLGTVCMTAGLVRFETTRAAVLPVGQLQVDVPARALLAGSAGNAAAGTVLSMAVAPVGIRRCDNPEPFLGGSDGETDSELRKRVLDTFQRLPNGANAAFYEQGALSFDEVAAASVLPRSRGIGTVDVVVSTHSGAGEGGRHRPDPAGGGFRPGDRGCRSGGRSEKLVFRRAPGQAGAAGTAVQPGLFLRRGGQLQAGRTG